MPIPRTVKTSVSLPEPTYRKAEAARRRGRKSRSALYAEALEAHLKALEVRDAEERYAAGYRNKPEDLGLVAAATRAGAALMAEEDW